MSEPRTILISGASGLVGRPLGALLAARGHVVRTLSRASGDFLWAPERGEIDASAMDGVDTVIHLAGETVAQRWTKAARARILRSRVKGAELLVREILKQDREVSYISASGTGYYGVHPAHPVREGDPRGDGFLADVCCRWEGAASPLIQAGRRCVLVRTGVVLSAEGGVLKKLLPPFKAGLGGRIGSGRQMMSWIALEDLVRVFVRAVDDEGLGGPVNAVAPKAVSNADFTRVLGRVLGRPTLFPLPAAVVVALFGEMGRETVLSDLNVLPGRLGKCEFSWKYPDLEAALSHTLDR